MSEKVIDSPIAWVADHIKEYVETNGEKGHDWNGTQVLLMSTKGRKSGDMRRCALIYGNDGDDFVIVASRGGDPKHPLWYLNLVAEPNVTLQIKSAVFPAVATEVEDAAEYERLWQLMLTQWPSYAEYQAKTDRKIPLVRLTRAE
jgi:deazaflavin-dependent oxidoreductase (nitroreductase family)